MNREKTFKQWSYQNEKLAVFDRAVNQMNNTNVSILISRYNLLTTEFRIRMEHWILTYFTSLHSVWIHVSLSIIVLWLTWLFILKLAWVPSYTDYTVCPWPMGTLFWSQPGSVPNPPIFLSVITCLLSHCPVSKDSKGQNILKWIAIRVGTA